MPNNAGLEIGYAAKEVEQLAGMRQRQRIPGEIAPGGRLARRHGRVGRGHEAAMARADLALAARERDVDLLPVGRPPAATIAWRIGWMCGNESSIAGQYTPESWVMPQLVSFQAR